MAYQRPPLFERRVFNPLAMRFGLGRISKLTIPGRRSGKPRSVPVIPVDHDGAQYLVSTRGEGQWVRNLRAAGDRGRLQAKDGAHTFRAVEVPPQERDPVIAAYRAKAGSYVDRYWKDLPDAVDHPVFRIEEG